MRALDFFMDWLTEQKKSEQIYIAKELLKNLDYFEHRDVMLEEIDRLDPHQQVEMREYIDELLENLLVVQRSDEVEENL